MNKTNNTSWERQGKWYNSLVGTKGHYFHEHLILPGVIRLLQLQKNHRLLDVGCGQGILAKQIPQNIPYTGIDLAKSLIQFAKNSDTNPLHTYIVANAIKPLPIKNRGFTHAAAILSLQNMEQAGLAIKNLSLCLKPYGKLVIVLNHPCFRIPRQSGWGIGENKLQYRYINRYMSPLKIPISMHPGSNTSEHTWSFHQPISYYSQNLKTAGFLIETIEEWTSGKTSQGQTAKMENRSRAEIPLFLAISAIKTC